MKHLCFTLIKRATEVMITIATFGLLLGNSSIAIAEDPVTVSVNAPLEAIVNSSFSITVDINNVSEFNAGQFDISFDDSVLQLDNVTSGLIDTTEIPVSLYNELCPGTYRIIVSVPGITGISGSGNLAVLHFHVTGQAGSSSDITLSNGLLGDNLAQEIPATWNNDSFNVIYGPATVSIDMPSEMISDSDFTATIDVTGMTDFDTGQFDISFDDSLLRLDNVTSGLIDTTDIPVSSWNEIDPGTHRIIVDVPGTLGISGSGYLTTLHFHVIGPACSSDITFSNGVLNDNLSQEISSVWVSNSLTVVYETAIVSVDVPSEVSADSDFSITLDLTTVTYFDLGQFDISFNESLLRLDNVTSGLIGTTEIPVSSWNELSPGVYRTIVDVPGIPGISGSGYLATLHFHVIGPGYSNSDITFSNGFLTDNLAQPIPSTWIDDSIAIVYEPVVGSIDVPSVILTNSDFSITIDVTKVTYFNAGQLDISFDDSVLQLDNVTSGLIDTTEIPVSLWNELSPGTYRIIVSVPGITGITGSGYLATLHFHVIGTAGSSSDITFSNGLLGDNLAQQIPSTWTDTSLYISQYQPDVNSDGVVNILDMIRLGQHLDETGSGGWIPEDVNKDGTVNVLDIIIIGQYWT